MDNRVKKLYREVLNNLGISEGNLGECAICTSDLTPDNVGKDMDGSLKISESNKLWCQSCVNILGTETPALYKDPDQVEPIVMWDDYESQYRQLKSAVREFTNSADEVVNDPSDENKTSLREDAESVISKVMELTKQLGVDIG